MLELLLVIILVVVLIVKVNNNIIINVLEEWTPCPASQRCWRRDSDRQGSQDVCGVLWQANVLSAINGKILLIAPDGSTSFQQSEYQRVLVYPPDYASKLHKLVIAAPTDTMTLRYSPWHSFLSMTMSCGPWAWDSSYINLHSLLFTKWCCLACKTAGQACCGKSGTFPMARTEGHGEEETIWRWISGWEMLQEQSWSRSHVWHNSSGGLESRRRPTET